MKRVLLAAVAAVAALVLMAPLWLRTLGAWLIVQDPLEHARAVVVLGGQAPLRAKEAARIFREGWAREIWLTPGRLSPDDRVLQSVGIEPPAEYAYARQLLVRVGVPEQAIRVLDGPTPDTAAEVIAAARTLAAAGGGRLIIVTSKSHTRRVRTTWRALSGARDAAIVRYAADDEFDPAGWWRTTEDALAVSREWLGLVNAWAGFPVKPKPN